MPVFNSTGTLKKVMSCPPTYFELAHMSHLAKRYIEQGRKADREVAKKQHVEFLDALQSAGVEIILEEAHPGHPFQVFTRDIGTNTKAGPLVGKFRWPERFGDEEFAIDVFNREGIQMVGRVTDGAFEGGDCYYLDDETLVVGIGNRSTHTGVEEARKILNPFGINVVGIEFHPKWDHLDGLFGLVAKKLCLAVKEELPENFIKMLTDRKFEIIEMSTDDANNVFLNILALGNAKVLSFKNNVKANKKLKSIGFEVYDPDISEILMGGGPHCLTFEIEREQE